MSTKTEANSARPISCKLIECLGRVRCDACLEMDARYPTDHTTATARISELEAEVERLRADAERYVMWRDNYCAATQGIEINPLLLKLADAWEIADVDAAIDQARLAQKGGA